MRAAFAFLAFLSLTNCTGGDGSCKLREEVNGMSIHSCLEQHDMSHDEYADMEHDCEHIAGLDDYVEGSFHDGLCPRKGIVGGCDVGDGDRLWYYPNENGYPSADDVFVICTIRDVKAVPPP